MRKTKIAVVLGLVLVLAITMAILPGCKEEAAETTETEEAAPEEEAAEEEMAEEEMEEPAEEEMAEEEMAEEEEALVHTNIDEFTYIKDPGEEPDLFTYYEQYGVEALCTYTGDGGVVSVDGLPEVMPEPAEEYTIGLALYFTVDEVGAFVLEGTEQAAEELGVNLLVNDANYDQNIQDQAIEQWILEGIDGILFYPADFNACGPILQKLNEADIPIMAGNPPLTDSTVNSVFTIDNVDIGRKGAQLILDKLEEEGTPLEGTIVFQNLPFLHPNAETREAGFREVLEPIEGIEIVELTGITPEEHYTAFEGAIQAHPDMIAAWGLYSSAVVGMSNAKKAAGRDDIILVGVDNDRPILAGIANGEITGTVGYSAFNHAYWTINNLVNILNGAELIPAQMIGPIETVTADNVAEMFEMYYGGRTLEDYLAGQ